MILMIYYIDDVFLTKNQPSLQNTIVNIKKHTSEY